MAKAAKKQQRTALVTGAGSGIGQACAELLLAAGWQVAFLDAPVSGGQAGAENGVLTVMIGGDEAAFAAAVTSSSASLAIIIPPSIPMILYAVMSGSSVVQLFVAGIVPGIIGGLLTSTLLTLVVVPVLYSYLARDKKAPATQETAGGAPLPLGMPADRD